MASTPKTLTGSKGRRDGSAVRRNRSNLQSRANLVQPCCLDEMDAWFRAELERVELAPERDLVIRVYKNLEAFVRWPRRAMLLWSGRDRSHKYHSYPDAIRRIAAQAGLRLDGRVNGPAIAAYRLAGGERPERLGSHNNWSVHHIYSGKFPYAGRDVTMHAAWDGKHCTQSAGLVAVHPIADQMCDEYPFVAWLLRAAAFERFGYDPDEVFSSRRHDAYGFVGRKCSVVTFDAADAGQCGRAARSGKTPHRGKS